mmetsp:Transcript_6687/g.19059  ORF Transcript_6687/g.19059 Transcript_6687/m.19059 type:complete len:206 (-) Transcript_6687:96-713(-)
MRGRLPGHREHRRLGGKLEGLVAHPSRRLPQPRAGLPRGRGLLGRLQGLVRQHPAEPRGDRVRQVGAFVSHGLQQGRRACRAGDLRPPQGRLQLDEVLHLRAAARRRRNVRGRVQRGHKGLAALPRGQGRRSHRLPPGPRPLSPRGDRGEDEDCAGEGDGGKVTALVLQCLIPRACGHLRYLQPAKADLMSRPGCAHNDRDILYP